MPATNRQRRSPGSTLRREIGLALVLKVCALALLYVAFFAPADRPAMSPAALGQHLFTSSAR